MLVKTFALDSLHFPPPMFLDLVKNIAKAHMLTVIDPQVHGYALSVFWQISSPIMSTNSNNPQDPSA